MSYQKLAHTRKQHTTPKCYLKNFSENGKRIFRKHKHPYVSEEKLEMELNKPASIETATVIEDFYTVQSGKEPMLVETLIYAREIENYYPKIYKILTDDTVQGFNMEERSRIFMCLLSLHCRTPKQFRLFFETIKNQISSEELEKVKEDYKGMHLSKTLTHFIEAHQFKRIIIYTITDNSEFITSDNPLLILGPDSQLKNNIFREQFNMANKIIIPIDKKRCCVLVHTKDKNGIDAQGKVFYNKIERTNVSSSFAIQTNRLMLDSADKCYYGSKYYLKAFFSFWQLAE